MPTSYDLILADPPWQYRNVKTGGSHTSGAAQKYPTLALWDLEILPIPRLAAKDCILALWATVPLGKDPYQLMESWGFCCQVGTKILTADLRWVDAERLQVGDRLVSFDDQRSGPSGHSRRYFQWGTVLSTGIEPLPCFEVVLADGTSLVCTGAHRWLMRTSHKGNESILRWVRTDALPLHLRHHSRHSSLELPRIVPLAEEDRSYEGGFLSAAFDAEGSIRQRKWNISFAQNENRLLSAVEGMLHEKGVVFRRYRTYQNPAGVNHLMFRGGRDETLRFLMRFRPPRLLDNWLKHNISATSIYNTQAVPVVEVKRVGTREVVTLMTDTGTYIANGFGAHNTYKTELFWHKVGRKGTGYWLRGEVEKLLIGIRGTVPAWRHNAPNWIEADGEPLSGLAATPSRVHSRKPGEIRDLLTGLTPGARRVELFATEYAVGWDSYGLDLGHDFRDPAFWTGLLPVAV